MTACAVVTVGRIDHTKRIDSVVKRTHDESRQMDLDPCPRRKSANRWVDG